jgi:hypothetical protein
VDKEAVRLIIEIPEVPLRLSEINENPNQKIDQLQEFIEKQEVKIRPTFSPNK